MVFKGWPAEAIEFFEGLEVDNSRSYFQANKKTYDEKVKRPMEELLDELGKEFGEARSSGRTATSASAPTSRRTRPRSRRR